MIQATVIPDRATAITAWRGWKIRSWFGRWGRTYLRSVNDPFTVWPAGTPMMAQCSHCADAPDDEWRSLVPSQCPGEGCTCGLYARKAPHKEYGDVYGQVLLWGKVIEHESGYRAQYAYPVSLYLPASLWRLRHSFKKAYGEIKTLPMPLFPKG